MPAFALLLNEAYLTLMVKKDCLLVRIARSVRAMTKHTTCSHSPGRVVTQSSRSRR